MQNDKTGQFILHLLFHGWKNSISFASLLGIIAFFVAPAMNTSWKIKYSIFISIGILILCFIVKVISQYYKAFIKDEFKPKAIRIIEGDGIYKGRKILVFSNDVYVSKNQILTMFCDSSGAPQPICMLRVLNITDKEIVVDQYPNDIELVDKYFDEESRKNSTYFSKNIDSVLLENQVIDGGK